MPPEFLHYGGIGRLAQAPAWRKFLATEVGLEVTSNVIQLVGGRGAYKDYPAERAFRDRVPRRSCPPTMDRMLEGIGKNALGLETGMFNVSGEAS